ncbi:mammalian cell entry protein [Mycobacterium sp. DSM 3803]|nr:mammalian cell entry protein [Mycobacterium sp. DSM 3803]
MSEQPEETETTAVEPEATVAAEKPRRGWRLFGRGSKAEPVDAEPEADPVDAAATTEPSPEARPKPRPVGKGRRGAVSEAADEPAADEPAADEAAEDEPADDEKLEDTGESTDEPEEPAADDSVVEAAAEETGVEAVTEGEASEEEAPEEEAKAPVLVPFRPAGKRLTYAAVGAAVLFVGAGAFAGAMAQPYLADRALVDTKLQVAQTSADAITTLWTYTPDNIDTLPDRAQRFLSNDFSNQYRTFIDSIAPTNKQAQISNNTQVMGTAVESISPTEATAIVYTNSVSTSPVTKNVPSLRYLSYRVSLVRDGSGWRITKMPALTQLDLSPQL